VTSSKLQHTFFRLNSSPQKLECQFVDTYGVRCTRNAINSHSLQRNGALKCIAENGHVYGLDTYTTKLKTGAKYKKLGLKKASISPGFCPKHDQELFRQVESGTEKLNKPDMLLLGYRSICHELFKKERVESIYSHPDFIKATLDIGGDAIDYVSTYLHGTIVGKADLVRHKRAYERMLHSGRHGNALGFSLYYETPLPFAYSGGFAPEFTSDGRKVLPNPADKRWGAVATFCGNIKGHNLFGCIGIDDVQSHNFDDFFASSDKIPDSFGASYALHIGLEYIENCYFKIPWLNDLPPNISSLIINRSISGTPGDLNARKRYILKNDDLMAQKCVSRNNFF